MKHTGIILCLAIPHTFEVHVLTDSFNVLLNFFFLHAYYHLLVLVINQSNYTVSLDLWSEFCLLTFVANLWFILPFT